jgi:uncharacterized iron-regulated protein
MLIDMNKVRTKILSLLAMSMLLVTCTTIFAAEGKPKLILQHHVLSGKIWDVRAGQFVTKEDLANWIKQSNYILLGETHDNPLHHQHQAWVLDNLRKFNKSAVVAFEMINQTQGKDIVGKQFQSVEALIHVLNQEKNSWDYEQNYKPVFASVLKSGYKILPASLDRSVLMSLAMKGEEKIPTYIVPYLKDDPLTPKQADSLREEIKSSHCGMATPHMTTTMMLVQRVKDAEMARTLMSVKNADVRVLVAGSGHVRDDRGVPMYLRRANKKVLSIGWIEVADELQTVDAYAKYWGGNKLPFDYVWFTARVDRPDPCEGIRHHLKMFKDVSGVKEPKKPRM